MGGSLLTRFGLESRRLPAAEYEVVAGEIQAALSHRLPPGARLEQLPCYRSKPDFGDCDLLLAWPEGAGPVDAWIESVAGVHPVRNDTVYSFPWRAFQIDVMRVAPAQFPMAFTYLSYNDLGNLMGRVFRSLGARYGHEGLRFILREDRAESVARPDAAVIAEIPLSSEPRCIFEAGDFDFDRFCEGFDLRDDLFEFVTRSRFFSPAIVSWEALDHANRIRNRKRPTYHAFLEWVDARAWPTPAPKWSPIERFSYWSERFPGLAQQVEDTERRAAAKVAGRERFNGALVRAWTGLDGPELGVTLKAFRSWMEQEGRDFAAWLATSADPQADFVAWFEQVDSGGTDRSVSEGNGG